MGPFRGIKKSRIPQNDASHWEDKVNQAVPEKLHPWVIWSRVHPSTRNVAKHLQRFGYQRAVVRTAFLHEIKPETPRWPKTHLRIKTQPTRKVYRTVQHDLRSDYWADQRQQNVQDSCIEMDHVHFDWFDQRRDPKKIKRQRQRSGRNQVNWSNSQYDKGIADWQWVHREQFRNRGAYPVPGFRNDRFNNSLHF